MRMNQIVNILVKKIQIIKKVKITKIQKMRIVKKLKTAQKLKTIKNHLHSMKWELVYDNDREEQLDRRSQLDQWFSTVQLESSIFYVFWML